MQDIVGWSWACCMHFSHRKRKWDECLIPISQTVVESLWWHIVHTSLAGSSVDSHVSITFSPSFLVSFVALWLCLLHVRHLLGSFPVNALLLASHHVPLSRSPNCFKGYIACTRFMVSMTSSVTFICCTLYCMCQIYGMEPLTDMLDIALVSTDLL